MPLPSGFKVNGLKSTSSSGIPIPPKVQHVQDSLDALPANELLTTLEVCERAGIGYGGSTLNHPILRNYKEKIDNKLFWGSHASIARLRKKLSEETHDEN
jgi:hypothetical protein